MDKWRNANLEDPPDGEYLVYYKKHFNVWEKERNLWFNEEGRVVTYDLYEVWWKPLPEPPKVY